MKKTLDLVYIALFAVILAICSWISIPTTVPFTLQTLGIFCTLNILGGKRGTIAILIYILLGAVGIPVFAGFSSGLGVLAGTTGGYIIGFIFTGLIYWAMTALISEKTYIKVIAMIIGLIVCYGFGTLWFMLVYAKSAGSIGLLTALGWCVFPFVIPDLIKMFLAFVLSKSVTSKIKV